MKEYDIMVVGPVSLDHNIDYLGNERKEVGGAVVASGFAAGAAVWLFVCAGVFGNAPYPAFSTAWTIPAVSKTDSS